MAFARFLEVFENQAVFSAIDGQHKGIVKEGLVSLSMKDISTENLNEKELFLDTGSPHHILFSEEVGDMDVRKEGAIIRYSERYERGGGTNVDFVQQTGEDTFLVRTYERGVEDETYSCGTGVTAVALAVHAIGKTRATTVYLETPGGKLSVSFEKEGKNYRNIWLHGPAKQVFKGEMEC